MKADNLIKLREDKLLRISNSVDKIILEDNNESHSSVSQKPTSQNLPSNNFSIPSSINLEESHESFRLKVIPVIPQTIEEKVLEKIIPHQTQVQNIISTKSSKISKKIAEKRTDFRTTSSKEKLSDPDRLKYKDLMQESFEMRQISERKKIIGLAKKQLTPHEEVQESDFEPVNTFKNSQVAKNKFKKVSVIKS